MHLVLYTSLDYQRAFGPSFVLGLVVVLVAGATATGMWWFYWAGATLLALALYRERPRVTRSGLSAAVLGFSVWLVLHALFIAPVFKPEAVFAAWFLVTSFLVAGRLTCVERSEVGKTIIGMVTLLALWGGIQHWLGLGTVNPEAGRAHAWFESPNTLASVINLALILLVVHSLLRGNRLALLTAAVLFFGLLATQSRGGWLGFAAGLVACAMLLHRARLTLHPVAKKMLAVVFVGGWCWRSFLLILVVPTCLNQLASV